MVPWPAARCLAAALLLASASGAAAQEPDPVTQRASQSRTRGQQDASVFVYEFADFQCPHCAKFALEVFPRIDSAFIRTGKLHWIFVNLPLPNHPNAWLAHEAALCAGVAADRFWPMHDRIFAGQQEWSGAADAGAIFARFAREAGVPADAWTACTAADRVAALLVQDIIFAATSRVNGTPVFNVNNEHSVIGLKSFEDWADLIERTLKAQAAKR